jgi:hypothetical protein
MAAKPRGRCIVPWGLLGMLGLVVAIERFVAQDLLDFSDPVSLSWRLAACAARDAAPGQTVLCAGDSLIKHGLIPRVIAARSGLAATNLAIARGPAPATFYLVRRALESGARPAALVVDFKPNVLAGGARYNRRYWPEILDAREILELAWSSRSASLLCELAVGRLIPSLRARLEVRGYPQAVLRGQTDRVSLINRVCLRNWTINDGANVAPTNPGFTGALEAGGDEKYQTGAFHCHRVNAEYIRRLLGLAASRGVKVYWLLPPVTPRLQARREAQGAEADFIQFVRRMQAQATNVTILDARHSGYDHSLFVDPTHLDGQGASTLSRDVADILARDLAAGAARPPARRWIDLPTYRAGPTLVVLEDLEQSQRAVSATR